MKTKQYYITILRKNVAYWQQHIRAKNLINALKKAESAFKKDNIIVNFECLLSYHQLDNWYLDIRTYDNFNMV